jgi:soluble lytic murein transglycosylase-like protein
VSRRDLEQSDQAVVEARKKIEDVAKQIAEAKAPPQKSDAIIIGRSAGSIAWSTGNKQIDNLISYNGQRYGVDPYLIYCVMNQESRFKTTAISTKGAQGLMQLMPATAARYGVSAPYDPSQSIMGGTRYLKYLLQMFDGKVHLVLAAYNAGEGAVMKYGNRIPPYKETQDYVRSITSRYSGNGLVKTMPKTSTDASANDGL